MKKIIIYIMLITLILNKNINVNASGGSFDDDAFSLDTVTNTYTMVDDSDIPTGEHFFYKYADGKAWYCTLSEAITLLSNKKYGITFTADFLTALVQYFDSYYLAYTGSSPAKINCVKKNGSLVGFALNSIGGCKLIDPVRNDSEIEVDSGVVNYIYVYIEDYKEDNGYNLPDFINVETRDIEFYKNKLKTNDYRYEAELNFLNNENFALCFFIYDSNSLTYTLSDSYQVGDIQEMYLVPTDYYTRFCEAHNLSDANKTVNFVDMMLDSQAVQLSCRLFDNGLIQQNYYGVDLQSGGLYTTAEINYTSRGAFGSTRLPCSTMRYLTVYKDVSILNQFVQETYSPQVFYSQQYYDYDYTTDNTTNTTVNEIDNSVTNNQTIYNESSESFTQYYTENNNHVDNSVTITNTTTIINNYYGDGDDGGDSGDDDDDDDDGLLDRLLNGILDIFKWLAKIITAILTGIVELFATVLEAIAGLTTSFSGITDFFSTIFSWLPDEIVTLMVLGLGLALLASFITWFK